MEHENDPRLRELLREWEVGDAPPRLDRRIVLPEPRGWRFWLQGSIQIPVPVGLVTVALLIALSVLALRPSPAVPAPATQEPAFNLADFRPAESVSVRVMGGSNVP